MTALRIKLHQIHYAFLAQLYALSESFRQRKGPGQRQTRARLDLSALEQKTQGAWQKLARFCDWVVEEFFSVRSFKQTAYVLSLPFVMLWSAMNRISNASFNALFSAKTIATQYAKGTSALLVQGISRRIAAASQWLIDHRPVMPRLPKFRMPEFSMPQISAPQISLPKLAIPKLEMPRIQYPAITLPKLSVPKITAPKFPQVDTKPVVLALLLAVVIAASVYGARQVEPAHVLSRMSADLASAKDWISRTMAPSSGPMQDLAQLEPAAGTEGAPQSAMPIVEDDNGKDGHYPIEERTLEVEGVLVPEKTTVISSSHDGKIKHIYFDDGEMFKKGDVLVEYACDDLRAEMAAVESESALKRQKALRSEKLFKLEIISDIEQMDLENDASKANAQMGVLKARMEACEIRATYDGRVVNRLANDSEYTRTDRVLMEVGSLDDLEVQFLVPSKWLRWINIDAPVSLSLEETGREYAAHIIRIHGEVDPVSQSIQVTAKLDSYDDPLLPGMSGKLLVDAKSIRDAGIYGYLEPASAQAKTDE